MKDWPALIGFIGSLWVIAAILIISLIILDHTSGDSIICTQAVGPNHSGKITCK